MKKYYFSLVIIFAVNCLSAQSNSKEIAFIGSKITINKITDGYAYTSDTIGCVEEPIYLTTFVHAKYEVKYKIRKILHGNYLGDTISFIAYSHYDSLEFPEYDNILFFLYRDDNGYVGLRERYIKVFETKDNRWASDYHLDGCNVFLRDAKIPMKKLEFMDDASFIIPIKHRDFISKYYPSPYYDINDFKATVIYGCYVEDVLKFLSGKLEYRTEKNCEIEVLFFD